MRHQRGQVLIALVVVLGLVMAYFSIQWWTPAKARIAQQRTTAQALQNAKAAIMSYALARATTGLPNLPCPPPAAANTLSDPGTCGRIGPANFTLGRIPWASLGAQRQADGAGGDIWYGVMDRSNRDFSPSGTYDAASNSYTKKFLQVVTSDTAGTTPTTVDAAFVVIAPGELKSSQKRPVFGQALGLPQTISGPPQAKRYSQYDLDDLDGQGKQNNYTVGGPFYTWRPESRDVRNDVVDYVSAEDYVRETERKVAQIVMKILEIVVTSYTGTDTSGKRTCSEAGCGLPHPADPANCQKGYIDNPNKPTQALNQNCHRQAPRCQGNFPLLFSVGTNFSKYLNDNSDTDYNWFYLQGWPQQIYYAIYSSGTGCSTKFSVNGIDQPDRTAVLLFPGLPMPVNGTMQSRPSSNSNYLDQYLEGNSNNKQYDADIQRGGVNFQTPGVGSNDLLCVFTCTTVKGGPDNSCGKLIKQCY